MMKDFFTLLRDSSLNAYIKLLNLFSWFQGKILLRRFIQQRNGIVNYDIFNRKFHSCNDQYYFINR